MRRVTLQPVVTSYLNLIDMVSLLTMIIVILGLMLN